MLDDYRRKRDFTKTKEPAAEKIPHEESQQAPQAKIEKAMFVVQKHNARRLHYDFRLEYDGVLKSWAVPKGLSDDPADKRLAVMTEDHPLGYANFHGTIPHGSYGAGTVEIWDKGQYVNITVKQGKVQPLSEGISKGHFMIFLKGAKLNGSYAFTKTGKDWIVVRMKEHQQQALKDEVIIDGHRIKLTNPSKEIDKGLTKSMFVQYYMDIAPLMLKHIENRLISMFRFPGGVSGKKFFQKNAPEYFPEWMPVRCIKDSSGSTCYATIKDEAGIVYLANQVVEPHIMVSKASQMPDKMIFDLDPSEEDIKALKDAAIMHHDFLKSLGLRPYIMTSGGKGYHIAVPIKPELENDKVRDFALRIAKVLATSNRSLTTELKKDKRAGRIFIDVNRISENQTSIAPYGVRARPRLPVAAPFHWDELPNIEPTSYTIKNYPKQDAWADFFRKEVSLKKIIEKMKNTQ